ALPHLGEEQHREAPRVVAQLQEDGDAGDDRDDDPGHRDDVEHERVSPHRSAGDNHASPRSSSAALAGWAPQPPREGQEDDAMPEMKVPGPAHPITLTAAPSRYQVLYAGHVIVDSRNAVLLKEASYKPVLYFPREDADMAYFHPTAHSTHCPYKGD